MRESGLPNLKIQENFAALLRESQDGCSLALGQLFNAYRPFLLAIAEQEMEPDLRKKGNPSDLVQETFAEAQRDLGQIKSDCEECFRAWLQTLLANNMADFRRRFKATQKRRLSRERPLTDPEAQEFLQILAVRCAVSPSSKLMSAEQVRRVQAALDRLRPEYREIILWHGRDELSFVEIGQRVGRSSDGVRMLFNRAIAKLRKELGDEQDGRP